MAAHHRRNLRYVWFAGLLLATTVVLLVCLGGARGEKIANAGTEADGSAAKSSSEAASGKTLRERHHGGRREPVDHRLARLFSDDKTGLKPKDFEKYLASRGNAPAALLACYLLADEDADLRSQLRFEDADVVVLANASFLPRPQFEKFTEANAAARLRELGADPAMASWLELEAANFETDPAKRMEALRVSMPKEFPVDAVDGLKREMRDALASAGVSGTQAEIEIELSGLGGNHGGRMATWVGDAWQQNSGSLSGRDKVEFAQSCLAALAVAGASSPQSATSAAWTELKILRDLPPDVVMKDGSTTAAARIAMLQPQADSLKAYGDRVTEAFLQADPATIDLFYSTLRSAGETAADAVLIPK